jgi:hypothetical protein
LPCTEKIQIGLKSDKSIGQFTRRRKSVYVELQVLSAATNCKFYQQQPTASSISSNQLQILSAATNCKFYQQQPIKSSISSNQCAIPYTIYFTSSLRATGIESRWGELFHNRPDRPWGPPSLLYNGYRVSSHPHLEPRLRKEYSYTSTPPLGLRGLL